MIHELTGAITHYLRKTGKLNKKELAEALGRDRKMIARWEQGQIPTPEQEKEFYKVTRVSTLQVAEFICKWVSDFIGRNVMIVPDEQVAYLPVLPLSRAVRHFNENYGRLTPEQRIAIEDKLRQARVFEASSEHMLSTFAQGVEQDIELALKKNPTALDTKTVSSTPEDPQAQ